VIHLKAEADIKKRSFSSEIKGNTGSLAFTVSGLNRVSQKNAKLPEKNYNSNTDSP